MQCARCCGQCFRRLPAGHFVQAGRQGGVEQFVLISSMGVTNPDHYLNKILDNVLRWKPRGEEVLRASGLRYTILRPGGLTDDPGGRQDIRVMQRDKPVRGSIARANVALVCVAALGDPDAIDRTVELLNDPLRAPAGRRIHFQGQAPDRAFSD
jgi:uncharacterized protein YbjT (DUF2867 family)